MPQPVELSDSLINAAREAAELAHRSLAAQVEHWATLGRAIEGTLTADQWATLTRGVQEARGEYRAKLDPEISERLAEALSRSVQPQFGKAVHKGLVQSARPTFGSHPDFPGRLVRRDPDGALTPGTIIKRKFTPDP